MSINEIKKDEKVTAVAAQKVAAKIEAPKAEPAKKEVAVKKAAPAKKAVPAKKAAPAKKAPAKKTVVANANVYIEFADNQYLAKDIREKCEAAFKKNNKGVAVKTIDIYVKPEENVAYYVVNGIANGSKVEL